MATTNAFALLSTDASDAKIVAEKKEAPKKKAPKKVAPAPAKKPEGVKAPQEVRGSKVPSSAVEEKRGGAKAPRSKLSIERGPNAGRTGKRPPKREFDRHDGTGRAHEGPKKKGAGRGNWGKPTDHVEKDEKQEEQAKEEKKEPELTAEEKALIELREKQRTVEQYQKEHKGGKTILRSAAAVEVACSVDEKNFAPISRVDLVAEQEKAIAAEKPKKAAAAPAKTEKAPKKAAKKEETATIEISFNEGRREHRKEAPKQAKVNVADKEAFPSLA